MTSNVAQVELTIDADDLLVTGADTLLDRRCRLFFKSVLGAIATDDGWRCPRRHVSLAAHVVRVNTFLERHGYAVIRHGLADHEVERELERRRSFQRTRQAATGFREGATLIDLEVVKQQLAEFGWSAARELRPHQEVGLAHALTATNAANFSVPGSGKTATALAVAASHLASGTVNLVIVVGPLAAFGPWERETRAALGSIIRTRRVRGTARERRIAYAAARPGGLLLISFASAAADRLALIEVCKAHNTMLIVDESHRIKRFKGGLWAPALVDVARHARVRMILSGTPMPQSGRDLFTQLNVLWPSGEITGSRDAFAVRVDSNFASVLRDVQPFMSRTPKQALGLPPYQVQRHKVELQGTQAEIYDLILTGLRRRVDGAETWADKLETLRRARPIRLLQAATNPDLFNRGDAYYRLPRVETPNPTLMDRLADYGTHEVPAKSLAALDLLTRIAAKGGKTVCWSNFVGNLDRFSALVRNRLGIPCFQIDGRVPTGDDASDDQSGLPRPNPDDTDTRERIIERFLNTHGAAVLVTNPASCSESISLHRGCHNAIYLDRTYDCAQFLQSIDRVHRLGLPDDVTVEIHILLATNDLRPSIDHLVDTSLRDKEAVMLELLEGAEVRPLRQTDDPSADAEGTEQDLAALLRYLLGETTEQPD
jgi:SNF2 family DNA or RNA helicase